MLFKIILFIAGFLLIALGLEMVLRNWHVLAAIVKACAGVVIALIGMVMMFAATIRR